LPTFKLTRAPFRSTFAGRGLCARTRPFFARLECFFVIRPTRQWRARILALALPSFCPMTFGTWHFGGVKVGGGG